MDIIKEDDRLFEILNITDKPIELIAKVARDCYASNGDNDERLVKNLINNQHFAMLEFADMTVRFSNNSRGLSHELVRHRVASFAQQSTRYVNKSNFKIKLPDTLSDNRRVNELLKDIDRLYTKLTTVDRVKNEDARQILPIGTSTVINIKANMREWRNIFALRCDHHAHWEIRYVMLDLLNHCKNNIPILFDDFEFFRDIKTGRVFADTVLPKTKLVYEILKYVSQFRKGKEFKDHRSPSLYQEIIEFVNSIDADKSNLRRADYEDLF